MSGNRGKGRPKGALNKATAQLKDMILEALSDAGGVDYLKRQANENPTAFLSLIGKVLPMQVAAPDGMSGKVTIEWQTGPSDGS